MSSWLVQWPQHLENMQGTTLAVAILGSLLVLLLKPPYALAAYLATLIWYPDYLRITIGTVGISAGRIVVIVLLVRCLCDSRLREKFVWSRLDTWITVSMPVYVGIYCLTVPFGQAIANRGGFLMDTYFAYLAARLCIFDGLAMTKTIKSVAVILVPFAILGVFEAVSGQCVYRPLLQYCPWRTEFPTYEPRWGFTRAWGSFGHPILFGDCFVIFLPLIWELRHQKGNWGKLAYPLCGMAAIGAFSSMSSGSWSMLIAAISCLAMEKYKRWVKPILISALLLCIMIGIVSNRPFYNVLAEKLNFGGGDWWQRTALIDCAIEDIGKWCWVGYGDRDPGWGAKMGTQFTDVNNEFIMAGVQYGMLGVIVLCVVLITAFRGLIRAWKLSSDVKLRSMYWSMGSILFAVIIAWMGVSFFGQMPSIFYSVLGMIGAFSGFSEHARTEVNKHLAVSDVHRKVWI